MPTSGSFSVTVPAGADDQVFPNGGLLVSCGDLRTEDGTYVVKTFTENIPAGLSIRYPFGSRDRLLDGTVSGFIVWITNRTTGI